MAYHIGSFLAATVDAMDVTGKIAPTNQNSNGNKCVAYEDARFSSFGGNTNKVQLVFSLPAGVYWTAMPYSSGGACLYCGFSSLADLLANAQFTPDLNGGALGGGVFGTSDDVAIALSQLGGLLILPSGIPYAGP